MASIIRSLSDKDSNHGGEISDLEDLFDSSTTTTTLPIVVGEMSSEVFNSQPSTTTQQLYFSQPSHRTISGGVEVEEDEQHHLANVVIAEDEGIPFVEEDQQERSMETEMVGEEDEQEEEEEDDYEYEDDDYAAFSGFLVNNDPSLSVSNHSNASATNNGNEAKPATIEEEVIAPSNVSLRSSSPVASSHKPKWRQPSEEAVNMSIRASKETSGNKRRLALDLYRIMNQDTDQAGFALLPKNDDCMDSWVIKLFQFDEDSKLAQDMKVLNVPYIELEMNFPDQYPFEPPFVRVSKPRFRRQTGFVMNGALCMELLTKDGWNPVNDIESVIVSIRSLLVVGDGRLEAASSLPEAKYAALLEAANQKKLSSSSKEQGDGENPSPSKKQKSEEGPLDLSATVSFAQGGSYSVSEAQAAYSHLSDYHKKKGWDTSGWWARKG